MSTVINTSIRSILSTLSDTQREIETVQNRLATGMKVSSALDNASAYFTAQSLNYRASDLSNRLDGMGQGIQVLKAADSGLKGLSKLVETAKGLADQAKATSVAGTRSSLATQFDSIRSQIDDLIADTGYNGTNLLNGDSLTVNFNEDASSTLAITGVTYDAAGLSIAAAANAWAADADIDAALADIDAALTTIRTQAATFGSSLTVVQTRQDFTQALVKTLQEGADRLVLADQNEESANMLALQTRQQLATTALALANQSQQSVLRLF